MSENELSYLEQILLLSLLAKLENKTTVELLEEYTNEVAEKTRNRYIVAWASALKDELDKLKGEHK